MAPVQAGCFVVLPYKELPSRKEMLLYKDSPNKRNSGCRTFPVEERQVAVWDRAVQEYIRSGIEHRVCANATEVAVYVSTLYAASVSAAMEQHQREERTRGLRPGCPRGLTRTTVISSKMEMESEPIRIPGLLVRKEKEPEAGLVQEPDEPVPEPAVPEDEEEEADQEKQRDYFAEWLERFQQMGEEEKREKLAVIRAICDMLNAHQEKMRRQRDRPPIPVCKCQMC